MAKKEGTDEAMAKGFVMQRRPSSLLQRFATIEEVANLVLYAASPQASATNGAAPRRWRRGAFDRLSAATSPRHCP
jgi:NAD(P)-dependent dehydrogenase (short-subunit alcohol dehydrogenase family)